MRLGLVTRNVADLVDLPRMPRREHIRVSPEEARRFLEVVSEHRLEALFFVAITTGGRQGELLGLTGDRVRAIAS